MTSNQSLQNKLPSKKDFKTSLTCVMIPAVINFIVSLVIFVFLPVSHFLTFDNIAAIRKNMSVCLTGNMVGYGFSMTFNYNFGIILVIIGMLFALMAFMFKMKKKTVNVYYSLSVDRKTMFKNRLIASLICIALALFVPILIDTIINIRVIGNAGYIVTCALLLFAECFVYELAGFVIMSLAMAVCHTFVESIAFGAGLVTLPTIIFSTVNAVADNFLRGFDTSSSLYGYNSGLFTSPDLLQRFSFLNPLFLGKNIKADSYIEDNIINFVHRDFNNMVFWKDDTVSCAEYLGEKISFDYILPLIIWVVISAVVIVIARQLFIKSKAENAGLHASVPIINELFAAEVGLILMDLWFTGLYEGSFASIKNAYICMLIGILLFLFGYFIIIMISKRTVKIKLRSLVCAGTGVAVSAVFFIVISTGGFGFSSYIPQASQIEWATVTYANLNTTMSESSVTGGYYSDVFSTETLMTPMGCFSDEEDIQSVIDINETAVQESDDMTDMGVYFYYRLKNGKTVYRYYDTVDRRIEKQLLSLRDSNAVKKELTYLLSDQDKDDTPITNLLKGSAIDPAEFFDYNDEKSVKSYFEKGIISVLDSDGDYVRGKIKNTPEFREALLKDLLAQSYEDRFMPKEKAVGMIEFADNYADDIDGDTKDMDEYAEEEYDSKEDYIYGLYGYYIYESMTNTVNYLKDTGEYDYFGSNEEALIESISVEKCSTIIDAQFAYYQYNDYTNSRLFSSTVEYEEDDYYTGIEPDEEFEPFSIANYFKDSLEITDEEQINELLALSHPFGYAEDDDYIICIHYKNKVNKTLLLPSNKVPDYIK